MLTSSANQYLRPEYLSPLPTNMDANKSPLALLAKTCSSIGVDSPNSKLLGASSGGDKSSSGGKGDHNSGSHHNSGDRNKKSGSSSVNSVNGDDDNSSQSNTTSCNSSKLSFKPYDISSKKSNTFSNNSNNNNNHIIGERNSDYNKSNDLVVSEKRSPSAHKMSPSPKSAGSTARNSPNNGSQSGKNTPQAQHHSNSSSHSVDSNHKNHKNESNSPKTTPSSDRPSVNGHSSSAAVSSALSFTSLGLPDMRLTADGHKESLNSLSNMYKSNPYSSNCCPINGIPSAHHMSVDKTGAYPSIYPPLSYARMKTANGGQAIMPMCRDPYCTGTCQLKAMQNAALMAQAAGGCSPATCPNGCNQCDHQRLMSSLAANAAYSQLNPALIPGLSQAYGQGLSQSYGSALAQSYAAAASAAGLYSPLAAGLPPPRPQSNNVCNWIAGDQHCGKRFANSEELLNHLRTHTSSSVDSVTSVPSLIPPGLSMGSTLNQSLAQHMHYSTAGGVPPPSLTSAAGLRRTYPTSLSPLSNRFHPYKPSVIPGLGAMPSVPSVPQMANPSALSMYYPYALYGQRIGPPVHP